LDIDLAFGRIAYSPSCQKGLMVRSMNPPLFLELKKKGLVLVIGVKGSSIHRMERFKAIFRS